jgi:hypothetical protein
MQTRAFLSGLSQYRRLWRIRYPLWSPVCALPARRSGQKEEIFTAKELEEQKLLDIMNHEVVPKCVLVYAGGSPIRLGVQPEFPDNPKVSRDGMKAERNFTNFTDFSPRLLSIPVSAYRRDAFYLTIYIKIQD